MNKSIEFTQSQIESYENRATVFMFPIVEYSEPIIRNNKAYKPQYFGNDRVEVEIKPPLQIGDKDIVIKEEFQTGNNLRDIQNQPLAKDVDILYKHFQFNSNKHNKEWAEVTIWEEASKMTKEQSRYTLKEVIDVRVARVKDIHTAREMENILGTNFISKSGNICIDDFDVLIDMFKKETNDNDYVFLVEVKR